MKVYFIDKFKRNNRLKKELEKLGVTSIEEKDTFTFRCTKNDFIILNEYSEKDLENEQILKFNNLIILTKDKSSKTIWKLATTLKTIDIIFDEGKTNYLAERISRLILN